MEESLKLALIEAGHLLAGVMGERLRESGFRNDVELFVTGDRVVIGSRARDARMAEAGTPGFAPTLSIEQAVHRSAPAIQQIIQTALEGEGRERTF